MRGAILDRVGQGALSEEVTKLGPCSAGYLGACDPLSST